jgi:hypothetical protein
MKALIPKQISKRFLKGLGFKTFRIFVLVVGLTVSFLYYGTVVHAEAVYSFTKSMGSTKGDFGQSVTTDSYGNVYITGYFSGTADFDPGASTDNHTSNGLEDIFLTKINFDGTYGWTKTMGGTDQDFGQSVAVDGSEDVYLTGYFSSINADFDPSAGTDNHSSAGLEDIFLTKINFDGTYGWTKTMGGTDQDFGQSVAVDGSDNVYITGYFSGTADFDPGASTDNHTSNGLEDIFLTKINSDGSYGFTKIMGGTDQDFGQSVTTDSYGNVYITGYFSGTADFDPGASTDNHTSNGLEDIFLTKINSDESYGFTKIMGGTDQDFGQSVAVDGSDNVYITGYFSGTADFDPGTSTDNHTSAGLKDIFIKKINFDGSYDLTATIGGTDNEVGKSVTLDNNVHLYLTGYFSGTDVDFNPGTGTDYHTSAGLEDIFLTKFRLVGFVITPASVTTNGAGDEASFTVRLLSEPSENVILPVSSSNLTIGTVDKSNLTFTYRDWSVDQTITVTSLVSSSQTYSIILAEIISGDADYNGLNPTDVTVRNVGSDSEGNGCFIATAAFGSSMEPHVKIMREFRDRFLIGNTVGKIFVHLYYTYSPPIADFIAKHDSLRILVRMSLFPVVGFSWITLKVGPVLTFVFMLFFISCFMGITWLRRRYKE